MPVVVKGYSVSFCIVSVDSGCGDHRSAEIPPNVFDNLRGFAAVGFGIDIKAVIMISINGRGCLLKGIGKFSAEFIKECCLKGITHEYVIKMCDITPQTTFAQSTFGKKAVDMRIPLQVSTKGVEDEDKAGSEQFRFVLFVEYTENDTSDSRKRQLSRGRSFKKKGLSSSAIVKTQCLCLTLMILKDMEVVRSIDYLFLQVGQKRILQRKGTNLRLPHLEHPYMAPP